MDNGAWQATVHGLKESDTTYQLNYHLYSYQGRIPWTQRPGWLQSLGSKRIRYD